jgi:hypothetical protein
LLDIAAKDDGVKHLVGRTAARVCWQLATRDDLSLLESTIQNPGTLEVLQGAISAMARQFADTEVLAAMSGVLLDTRPVAARMAAEAAVPRTSYQQLRAFLAHNQQKLSPQVLAVFDWHLYAPPFLKEAYEQWRKTQSEVPPNCW